MIAAGFSYMVVGMTVVFSFLLILVFLVWAMSALANKYFPEKESETEHVHFEEKDNDIVAVLAAVVRNYSCE
jgi:oxaloacetate decarboxylase (Na+ extruding) subunit gamma